MSSSSQVPLEEAFQLARKHRNAGNLIVAERAYRDILESTPDEPDAQFELALVCWSRGKRQETRDLLDKALAAKGDDAGVLNAHAVVSHEMGRPEDAVADWRRALELAPDNAGMLGNLGLALVTIGEVDEAIERCRAALALDPEHTSAALNLGRALQTSGRLHEAVEVWEDLAARQPEAVKAHANLGNAYRDLGRPVDAEAACRRALALDSESALAHNNLGNALLDQAKLAEAESAFERATELAADYSDAINNLGVARQLQGRFEDAAKAHRFALALDADDAKAHAHLSNALREQGEFAKAENAIQQAVYLAPDEVDYHLLHAELLIAADRADEAEAVVNHAVSLSPDSAQARTKLARALSLAGRYQEAIDEARQAVELQPDLAWTHHALAAAHFWAGNNAEAEAAAHKAIEIAPRFAQAYVWLGDFYQILGRTEEADRYARQALEIDPNTPGAYIALANSKRFTPDDPDLRAMEALYNSARSPIMRGRLCFALGKAYEQIGEDDKAFDAYQEANDVRRRGLVFNQVAQRERVKRIKTVFTREWLDEMAGAGDPSPVPVFIVGMPRSGTTLVEQIISSHPEVHGAGELPLMNTIMQETGTFDRDTIARIGPRYVETVRQDAPHAARITDKMPGNFANLGAIVAAMPKAAIIHCRRDPVDTCFSCFKQNFARGQHWSFDLTELGEQYRLYADLMDHWREVMPGRFLEVDYEDVVADTETMARRLIAHVGLEWDDACLAFHETERPVKTASKMQVRQPIYGSSVAKWRRFEQRLEPLLTALGDHAPPRSETT
ncbi:Flp pilus assembly protein TadD, contains TPR repeats [Limimonas halophila]|uniref:Flp pilus assembly protein TadD, contains TPR repeats n=1 Tax=Limimonas halophila TaxID=1082479 RepID=A0A1G7M8M0_9PROT|nr:tetratricopeptide repeat-containing sulfotransferase family protein [Limimonas halophila]SDF57540.1 Flp pilus assembly protein TadD, contains TPR repeats [Limimonas halophila]